MNDSLKKHIDAYAELAKVLEPMIHPSRILEAARKLDDRIIAGE